jgi:hypothetical protein
MATEGEEPNGIRGSKRGLCGPSPLERILVIGLWLTEGINVVDLWCFLEKRSSFGPRGLSGVWYFLFPFNSSHNSFSSFAWASCLLKSFTEEKQREITASFHLVIKMIKLHCDTHNLCLETNIIKVMRTNRLKVSINSFSNRNSLNILSIVKHREIIHLKKEKKHRDSI